MTNWVRFRHQGKTGFGTLTQSDIIVHDGEMFDGAKPNGRQLALSDVELLAPTEPTKNHVLTKPETTSAVTAV